MGEGFRLKTQRFRGQISQGLILPVSILPNDKEYSLGEDVSDILQVCKWEIEETEGAIISKMKIVRLKGEHYAERESEFRTFD